MGGSAQADEAPRFTGRSVVALVSRSTDGHVLTDTLIAPEPLAEETIR